VRDFSGDSAFFFTLSRFSSAQVAYVSRAATDSRCDSLLALH
jgi:hypothetical protein